MMSKPVNYHLVGFAYSGKTTLARELESRLGFARISIDEIKWEMGFSDVGDDAVPDYIWDTIMARADQQLAGYLKEGRSVANEYAWATRQWRDRSRAIATATGAETVFIYLSVAEPEIRRRWVENSLKKFRFHMPEVEFDRMFEEFEPKGADESVLVYDGFSDVQQWIERHLLPLHK